MQIKLFAIFSCVLCSAYCNNVRISRDTNVCGDPQRSVGFIVHGEKFKHGDFPWIVALLYNLASPPAFFCGGTLVSMSHVITAAHCIKPKYGQSSWLQQLYASDILALFGAYNLTNQHESGRSSITPDEIQVHRDWNHHVERYDADIAVLKFAKGEIPMTRYIKPICLLDIEPTEREGVVAGWGRSEDQSKNHETIPKKLTLPMHSNSDCFLETPDLAKLASNRTFCAGVKGGRGVCLGDSGNGFFIKVGNIYFLRGIVSSSKLTATSCDVEKYAVYTDVLQFKHWIIQIIGDEAISMKNNGVVIETTTAKMIPVLRQAIVVEDDKESEESSFQKKSAAVASYVEQNYEKALDATKELGNDAVSWVSSQSGSLSSKLKFW